MTGNCLPAQLTASYVGQGSQKRQAWSLYSCARIPARQCDLKQKLGFAGRHLYRVRPLHNKSHRARHDRAFTGWVHRTKSGLGRGLTSSRNLVPDLAKSLLFSVRVSVQPDEFAFTDLRARSWSRPASSRGPRSCAVSLNFTHCHRRMATSHESSTELLQQQHRAAASASAPACRHEAARGTAHEPRDLQPACAYEVL